MKKIFYLAGILVLSVILSCGPTAEEKKKVSEEQLKSDMDTSFPDVDQAIDALDEPEAGDSTEKDSTGRN